MDKPFVDKDRMAAGGGSYGGYLASILLGREHPFKTLVAHAAVYNTVHADRLGLRRGEAALLQLLGKAGGVRAQLAAHDGGELQDADAGDPQPDGPCACR